MALEKQDEQHMLHIVMYPWYGLSHLTSFLRLGNKLAQRGHKISFILPTKTQTKLAPQNYRPHFITFYPIVVPTVEGLPPGAETPHDIPRSAIPALIAAMDLTRGTIDSIVTQLKPDLIFFDFAHWMPELARAHGAKSVYYATSSIARYAYFSLGGARPSNRDPTEAELVQAPPGFPCPEMRMRAPEARFLIAATQGHGGGMSLSTKFSISLKECDAIASKTCRELEGPFCDFYETSMGKPLLLAGPLIPEPPTTTLDSRFGDWLKGFDEGNVIYCALGSECVLEKNQFQELVLGLELTGKPFLAAIKPPSGYATIESALPEGFQERTKGRGIVHGGWVQQPLILQHPSIGCFVTHCGAGSLSEAILSKCQLVLLPQAVDQFINARMMSMYLRVGVEIEKGDDDCFSTKEDVCKAISMVMEEDSQIGKELKANHAKWRELLSKEGLEDSYVDEFISKLQNLVR